MKLMLICTSGGHFATMQSLEKFWSQHERVWVTDYKADTLILENKEKVRWLPYQGPRDFKMSLKNLPKAFKLIQREKPDLIVSTGANVAVNFAWIAKVFDIKFVFIESLSRSTELSLTGRLVYPMCDEVYVQWPHLTKRYKKAVFAGYI